MLWKFNSRFVRCCIRRGIFPVSKTWYLTERHSRRMVNVEAIYRHTKNIPWRCGSVQVLKTIFTRVRLGSHWPSNTRVDMARCTHVRSTWHGFEIIIHPTLKSVKVKRHTIRVKASPNACQSSIDGRVSLIRINCITWLKSYPSRDTKTYAQGVRSGLDIPTFSSMNRPHSFPCRVFLLL